MEAATWDADLVVSDDVVTLALNVDSRSLKVRWGFNGLDSLTDKHRDDISQTIEDKVLHGVTISFRSKSSSPYGDAVVMMGDLTIGTATRTISFELRPSPDGSRIDAKARIIQTDFGLTPYSAMLGTLKVKDAVEIVARATLPRTWSQTTVSEPEELLSAPVDTAVEQVAMPEYEALEPALVAEHVAVPEYAPEPEHVAVPEYAPEPAYAAMPEYEALPAYETLEPAPVERVPERELKTAELTMAEQLSRWRLARWRGDSRVEQSRRWRIRL